MTAAKQTGDCDLFLLSLCLAEGVRFRAGRLLAGFLQHIVNKDNKGCPACAERCAPRSGYLPMSFARIEGRDFLPVTRL